MAQYRYSAVKKIQHSTSKHRIVVVQTDAAQYKHELANIVVRTMIVAIATGPGRTSDIKTQ